MLVTNRHRTEYRNKTITRLFGGNTRYGCYFLAFMIFAFGILRDSLCVFPNILHRTFHLILPLRYHRAILEQPQQSILPAEYTTIVPAVLFILGQTFVVTSTWALGITGTFLGDYFGILMDSRVEGYVASFPAGESFTEFFFCAISFLRFPFNVLRDPMYVGSTMCFAATALWYVIRL